MMMMIVLMLKAYLQHAIGQFCNFLFWSIRLTWLLSWYFNWYFETIMNVFCVKRLGSMISKKAMLQCHPANPSILWNSQPEVKIRKGTDGSLKLPQSPQRLNGCIGLSVRSLMASLVGSCGPKFFPQSIPSSSSELRNLHNLRSCMYRNMCMFCNKEGNILVLEFSRFTLKLRALRISSI